MPASRGRLRVGRVGCAVLRVLVAAQNSGAGAGHQQQQRRHRRGLQAGKIVQNAFAKALVPAFGRQCVQRFVKAQARAGHQIRSRLRDRMRVGENFERQHLLALFPALRAAGHMPIQLVHQLVGQLAISCRHHPFMC